MCLGRLQSDAVDTPSATRKICMSGRLCQSLGIHRETHRYRCTVSAAAWVLASGASSGHPQSTSIARLLPSTHRQVLDSVRRRRRRDAMAAGHDGDNGRRIDALHLRTEARAGAVSRAPAASRTAASGQTARRRRRRRPRRTASTLSLRRRTRCRMRPRRRQVGAATRKPPARAGRTEIAAPQQARDPTTARVM